ncbi:MAG: hypothetical protein ACPGUD_12430 [Parashewanella sp.]
MDFLPNDYIDVIRSAFIGCGCIVAIIWERDRKRKLRKITVYLERRHPDIFQRFHHNPMKMKPKEAFNLNFQQWLGCVELDKLNDQTLSSLVQELRHKMRRIQYVAIISISISLALGFFTASG